MKNKETAWGIRFGNVLGYATIRSSKDDCIKDYMKDSDRDWDEIKEKTNIRCVKVKIKYKKG
jgi:hypothetical protein